MNGAVKAMLFNSPRICMHLRATLFHSTPSLDRKRRTHWDSSSGFNYDNRSFRKLHRKQTLLRNVTAHVDWLFNKWEHDFDVDPCSSDSPSWFRGNWCGKESKRGSNGNQGHKHRGRSGFQFIQDDVEVETIIRSAFGGSGHFYWSFFSGDSHWTSSSDHSKTSWKTSWKWTDQSDEEFDSSAPSEDSASNLASERKALGLSASGPLQVKEVKDAYRVCALKWHPDRHQGSSKVVAEEKFKACSAAYESLCSKLALN